MKTTTKWRRVRPGYYRIGNEGETHAIVERGAETGRWWWTVYSKSRRAWHSAWSTKLIDAQVAATNCMERPE